MTTQLCGSDLESSMKEMKMRELKAAMVARTCEDLEPLRVAIEKAREVELDQGEIDQASRILSELEVQMQPMAFTDVPQVEMQALQVCTSREEILKSLKSRMRLPKEGFKAEVLAEFHFQNFMFCQRQGFGPEKASTLLSLLRVLHSKTVAERPASLEEATVLLEELLGRHSRQLPPFSVGIFSQQEVSEIRSFVKRSFLRRLKMFQFIYKRREDMSLVAAAPKPRVTNTGSMLHKNSADPQEAQREAAGAGTRASKSTNEHLDEEVDSAPRPANATEAKVLQVMDDALKDRLSALESKMSTLPI
ncbi:unnamed protein product [Effrenium voratum]|uniref:Uncharacterized protein n=1 Tax=Effrenium voratum TaxID=2562239 RepID=A0AA36ND07_9DINO|nr:unnamed protein product [Effrenium voratum]CAJ1397763.1 unnamed protein product [Effrenium voratum]CAJ1430529.1 unnamed protein product [Effrenium voratum]|eukprot:CAMPEP_0181473132 /NCGR_PEP_ID=MMETSP1110-20121109/39966_1 /TAXON_ID=174948 /ORGANISM="Symbiodinium sp., Strain CCMP421" /LENGTH=304 /DNA_ID=CAMNT_0023598239 /DNA_START=16 /DNA_END=930 /DNA_ORIENTATION=-